MKAITFIVMGIAALLVVKEFGLGPWLLAAGSWFICGYLAAMQFRKTCPPIPGLDDAPLVTGFIIFGPISWIIIWRAQ